MTKETKYRLHIAAPCTKAVHHAPQLYCTHHCIPAASLLSLTQTGKSLNATYQHSRYSRPKTQPRIGKNGRYHPQMHPKLPQNCKTLPITRPVAALGSCRGCGFSDLLSAAPKIPGIFWVLCRCRLLNQYFPALCIWRAAEQ